MVIICVICLQYCHLRVESELSQQTVQQPQVSSASWDLQGNLGIFIASRFCVTKMYIWLCYKLCYSHECSTVFSDSHRFQGSLYLICILTTGMKSGQPEASTRKTDMHHVYFCWRRLSHCKATFENPRYETAFLFSSSFTQCRNCCHTFPTIFLFPMILVSFYKVSNPQGSLNIHTLNIHYSKSHHVLSFESLKIMLSSTTKQFNMLLTGTIL